METILYTNNKREGSNYHTDRITYAQCMDGKQLLQNEMSKYNINHIHFWFVKENIAGDINKEDNLLINIGKYLMERNRLKFYYVVEKYHGDRKQLSKEELVKEQIIFAQLKQYEQFIRNQLLATTDPQIIKRYVFKNEQLSVVISLFQLAQKNLVLQLVEDQSKQIYNAKLNYRKISTIQPESYEKKKLEQIPRPVQMHHKLILYLLYNPPKPEEPQVKKRKQVKVSNINQMSLQALAPWKIKEDAQSLAKYERECELIKQQIENQKIVFRNKIKLIENYIGDSINVDKLYLEEEDVTVNNQLNNTVGAPTFKKVPNLTKRVSIAPTPNQTISSNAEKLSKYNNTSNTLNSFIHVTEFKRLKDINEAMRNIDNTLFDQSKKIEHLRAKTKQLHKFKEEIMFRQAKQLNAVKKELLELAQEMDRKENQIQEKKRNGQFEVYSQYKSKEPSEKGKQILKQHIQFLNQYQKPVTITQPFTPPPSHTVSYSSQKVREKRVKQAQLTLQRLKQAKHSNMGLQARVGKKAEGQLSELISQLSHLYKYYLNNNLIIQTANKQISNYKCHPTHTANKSSIHSLHSTLVEPSQQLINLDHFPILKSWLNKQSTEDDCLPSVKHEKHKSQYNFQSQYPRDCFELMLGKQTEKGKRSIRQKRQSVDSSSKDEEGVRVQALPKAPSYQQLKDKVNIQPKPSKFKRITIEQALQSSNLLKKVVRINNGWQNQ